MCFSLESIFIFRLRVHSPQQHHQMQLQHQQMHQQQQQQLQLSQQESAMKAAASGPNTFPRMPNTMPRVPNTFPNVPNTFGGEDEQNVQMRDDSGGATAKTFPGMPKSYPGPPKTPTVPEPPTNFANANLKPPNPNVIAPNAVAVAVAPQPHPNQQKEFNTVSLCRYGQETVQDILSRFQEVFGALRSVQPPNTNLQATAATATTEKKVTEQFRTIRLLFKRLRLLFDRCNDSCQLGKFIVVIYSLRFSLHEYSTNSRPFGRHGLHQY